MVLFFDFVVYVKCFIISFTFESFRSATIIFVYLGMSLWFKNFDNVVEIVVEK